MNFEVLVVVWVTVPQSLNELIVMRVVQLLSLHKPLADPNLTVLVLAFFCAFFSHPPVGFAELLAQQA